MWFTNLETLMDISIFICCSTNVLGNLLKGDMILLYYNALHVWLTTLLQLAITLSSFHARRQEGHSTLWRSPPQILRRKGNVWSLYLNHFCRTVRRLLIYSYSDCSTIMVYTGDRWIQHVQLHYVFVLHAIYICVCRRGCCRLVGEGILLFTMYVIWLGWNKREVGRP